LKKNSPEGERDTAPQTKYNPQNLNAAGEGSDGDAENVQGVRCPQVEQGQARQATTQTLTLNSQP